MNHEERNRVLSKIQKLLNLANDKGASQGEIDNALSIVSKLKAKYDVVESELLVNGVEINDKLVGEWIEPTNFNKRIPKWYNILATCISEVFDCASRIHQVEVDGNVKVVYYLYGYNTDVVVARWLFQYLSAQINKLADINWKSKFIQIEIGRGRKPYASERTNYKNAYRQGLVTGLLPKIKLVYEKAKVEAEVEANAISGCTTLATISKSGQIKKQFGFGIGEDFINIKNPNNYSFTQGYRDRDKVNINRIIKSKKQAVVRSML